MYGIERTAQIPCGFLVPLASQVKHVANLTDSHAKGEWATARGSIERNARCTSTNAHIRGTPEAASAGLAQKNEVLLFRRYGFHLILKQVVHVHAPFFLFSIAGGPILIWGWGFLFRARHMRAAHREHVAMARTVAPEEVAREPRALRGGLCLEFENFAEYGEGLT
jgi:hypothetical protein